MPVKWMRLALAAAVVLSAAGTAAAQDVKYNALPDTDFTKFKTYKWVKIEGGDAGGPDHGHPDQDGRGQAAGRQGSDEDR